MKKFFYLFLVLVVAFSALPVFAQAVKKVKVTKSIRKGPDTRWSVEMTGDEIKLYKWEEATPYTIVFKNDKTGELVQIFDKFSEFVAVSQANRPVNLKKDIGRIDSPNPVIRVNNFIYKLTDKGVNLIELRDERGILRGEFSPEDVRNFRKLLFESEHYK